MIEPTSRRHLQRLAATLAVVSLWVCVAPASAQQSPPDAPAAESSTADTAGPSLEAVTARLAEIESQEGLDAELKTKVVDLFKTAQSALGSAAELRSRAASYKSSIETAPKAATEIEVRLADGSSEEETPVPTPQGGPKELALELKKLQAELAAEESALARRADEISTEQGRPEKAREEQADAQEKLASLAKSLSAGTAGQNPLLAEANQAAMQARAIRRREQIAMLEQEILSHGPRLDLMRAQHELAKLTVSKLKRQVTTLQDLESAARAKEAEAARLEAERASREAEGKHAVITTIARENAKLGDELTDTIQAEAEVRDARDLKETPNKQLKDVYNRTKAQIESAGVGSVGGTVLRQRQRKQLPEIIRDNERVAARWGGTLATAEARLFQIGLERNELTNLAQAVEQRLNSFEPPVPEAVRAQVSSDLEEQLVARKDLLKRLEATYETHIEALRALEKTQEELGSTAKQFAKLLDEWLLWIPSSAPPDLTTVESLWNAILWLRAPEQWADAGRTLYSDFASRPLLPVLTLLVVLALSFARPRLYRAYAEAGKPVGSIQRDSIRYTLIALGLSLLVVLPLSLLTAFIGWRLTAGAATATFAFTGALGNALLSLASLFFSIRFFLAICRPGGVAELHFRWKQETLVLLRKHLTWLLGVIPFTFFLVTLTDSQPNEEIQNSLGRLSFIVGMGALALFVQRVFRPRGILLGPILLKKPDGWLSRLRHVWYPLAIGVPLALAVIAAVGYYYTAITLETRLAASVVLVVGVILLEQLAQRWLVVSARRLAVEKARQAREARRAKEEAAKAAGQDTPGSGAEEVLLDDDEVDLATVNEQTRRLLHTTINLALVFGLWGIWAAALPALGILNEVQLWETLVLDEAGATVPQWITLQNVILALFALVITAVAAKNLPGLLEIAILQNLPLEAGMRYALATVSQYVVTVVGLVISFQLVGIGWAKVQWLVAALSVGVGFGLQEIIANFFCGLILLFERPIRIGDIVRVGDVTGTVSKIRIRATTITDWDRMDYIVPNKELITGRLLNWTLSNTINRIVINVGIAYECDPEKARELLLKVAHEHPLLLSDPGPIATFEGFGDSTLNCVLRCYLPDFNNRLATIDELHAAINREFKAAGIEIAFPQLDLHLRSSDLQDLNKHDQTSQAT